MTLNVVCIKWGDKYGPEYVNNLAGGVRRNLTVPHRFVCLTDDSRGIDSDVETRSLLEDLPGWWNKLALFKQRIHDLRGTMLFVDLDMVVIRDLDPVALDPRSFLAVQSAPHVNEFSSALLRFEIGRHTRIWELFEQRADDVMRQVFGDQNWINACVGHAVVGDYTSKVRQLWPEVTPEKCSLEGLPRHWFPSFKRDLQQSSEQLGEDAKVIVFHGRPMVHEVDWMMPLWCGERVGRRRAQARRASE